MKTGLPDLDVTIEYDERTGAAVGDRGGAPIGFELEPIEPERVSAFRLGHRQLWPLDDPPQGAECRT